MSADKMAQAMAQADEYARYVRRGETALAAQACENMLLLVGRYEDGIQVLPACVVDAARGRRTNRTGMVPAGEMQTLADERRASAKAVKP
jgi:hypothetical protein